jgi:hypothetical protein
MEEREDYCRRLLCAWPYAEVGSVLEVSFNTFTTERVFRLGQNDRADDLMAGNLRSQKRFPLGWSEYVNFTSCRLGERLADRVASFGGSWTFIILFLCAITVWMGNTV